MNAYVVVALLAVALVALIEQEPINRHAGEVPVALWDGTRFIEGLASVVRLGVEEQLQGRVDCLAVRLPIAKLVVSVFHLVRRFVFPVFAHYFLLRFNSALISARLPALAQHQPDNFDVYRKHKL